MSDPKLDGLRAEYDRHSDDWRRNGKAVRYELAEAAWRDVVTHIAGRERERWEASLRTAQGQMLGLSSTLNYDDNVQAQLHVWAEEMPVEMAPFWRDYIDRVRAEKGRLVWGSKGPALLQPEQGGQ